jgi:fluoride ion exporter CrcB/FEX
MVGDQNINVDNISSSTASATAGPDGSAIIQAEMHSLSQPTNSKSPNQQVKQIQLASGPPDSQYDSTLSMSYYEAEIPNVDRTFSVRTGDQVEPKSELEEPTIELSENKLAIFTALVPVSILGVLIRIGLNLLETYDGAPVFYLAYAQFIGCVIMGVVVKKKDYLIKRYLPLQIALSTGLCGSITTFSSWQLGIFESFANYAGADHVRGYSVA